MILANLGSVICLFLGILAVFKPHWVELLVSVQAIGKEGKSEVRATYGGFFAGMAIYALCVQMSVVFVAIGVGWLTAAAVRLLSIFCNSYTGKNVGGALFEGGIGVLFVWECVV